MSSNTWPIGSDFESPHAEDLFPERTPPWHQTEPLTYVSTGRQALHLIGRELRRAGYKEVLLPYHHCETMRAPLESAGLASILVPIDSAFAMSVDALNALKRQRGRAAVLHVETFGIPTSSELSNWLANYHNQGGSVVLDQTHSLFDEVSVKHTYRFGSLRKLLPVPDGAFVDGLDSSSIAAVDPEVPEFAAAREHAAGLKERALRGHAGAEDYRDAFLGANSLILDTWPATAMSQRTHALIKQLDYERYRTARTANAMFLAERLRRLERIEVVSPRTDGAGTPAFVAIRTPNARELQSYLARNRVFAPIHWPRPSDLPAERPWETNVLSLPIDHRYGIPEMDRISQLVALAARKGSIS